jgi:hypothetical protein
MPNQFNPELKEKRMTASERNMTTTPEIETIEVQTMQPGPDRFHSRPGGRRRTVIFIAAATLAALALLIYSGIHSRAVAESRLTQQTQQAAVPTVAVVFPREGAPTQEIVLPGNTQASGVSTSNCCRLERISIPRKPT